jgi:DNA-binding NtrC family response regulator
VHLDRIGLLAVVGDDREYEEIENVLCHCNWNVLRVRNCKEALSWLQAFEAPVVLCSAQMPDGCWRKLLSGLKQLPDPPRLILISELDMPLWAEFVSLGGFDILARPLDPAEFFQAVTTAWQDWRDRQLATDCASSLDPARVA